jgi:hypothetical protein
MKDSLAHDCHIALTLGSFGNAGTLVLWRSECHLWYLAKVPLRNDRDHQDLKRPR